MAYTQLILYNEALLLAGQRSLSSTSEAREPRYKLDEVYSSNQSIEYCLELAKPTFARKTTRLNSASAHTTFAYKHQLPSDYVTIIELYSDSGLNQKVSRYVIEGDYILCDFDDVYLRFVSNGYTLADWDTSFGKFFAAYMAVEIATRLSKEDYIKLERTYEKRLQIAIAIAEDAEARSRPKEIGSALSSDWLTIYNDALLILGLEDIVTVNDDSNRRFRLTQALNAGIVEDLLEDTGWQFGQVTEEMTYNNAIEPEFGYKYAFNKPAKLHRIKGVFVDEYQQVPLKFYQDESDYFFADVQEFYLSYVSTDYLTTPSDWPTFFKRLVGARMALDAGPSLVSEGANLENAKQQFQERESSAKSKDAMASPPRLLATGSWLGNRFKGNSGQGRP